MINVDLEMKLAGRFKVEAFRADADGNEIAGSRRVAADWFSNLITNAGLNELGATANWGGLSSGQIFFACGVGSGSTTPAFTDTALVSQVARSSTKQSDTNGAQGAAPYFGWRRITYRFDAGVAAGNLAEVGIFTDASAGVCWSRALILDGSGNPTTITVLPDEILDVTYECRNYPPTADVPWSATISGVSYSGIVRAQSVTDNSYTGLWAPGAWIGSGSFGVMVNTPAGNGYCQAYSTQTLGDITGSPAGTGFPAQTGSASAYVNGNYYRDHTVIWDVTRGNAPGGIGSFRFMSIMGSFQMSVTPVIPKDNTKTMSINVRVSWGRYS
ncbi:MULTISPECIES: hypothetical protein [unclassified Xanthomonas]|uniref:hypothetical protein n=1 Tax=unclassified Xanthomonas TaxID=2643310 RepID=UPI002A811DB8|nr:MULTISPECIES: hypothetical protein [unclassified Xanthomonas]MDY4297508.1 hypothetical protein [Xanthomonas sp. LF02-5]MDY4359302.1 hypothetical protein [Xanthomonas sp. LF04-12]